MTDVFFQISILQDNKVGKAILETVMKGSVETIKDTVIKIDALLAKQPSRLRFLRY